MGSPRHELSVKSYWIHHKFATEDWVPVRAFVALPDNTDLLLNKTHFLFLCRQAFGNHTWTLKRKKLGEREAELAAPLREPEGSYEWPVSSRALTTKTDIPLCSSGTTATLTLKTCKQGRTPRGHEASDTVSTWLPNQGMSEREQGSKMWSRRMLFLVSYVGLAQSGCWWSFLINAFYSLNIKRWKINHWIA